MMRFVSKFFSKFVMPALGGHSTLCFSGSRHKAGMTLLLLLLFFTNISFAQETPAPVETEISPQPQHAIALHGTPKYGPDFKHLDYVNPDAPKGGTLRSDVVGTFDSLNPFIVKGTPAAGLNYIRSGFVYESLMQNSWDEPFSLYGILAESIEVADDRSWVAFTLRPEARWQDGKPITAEDVVWTFNTLTGPGAQPFFKAYWHDVTEVIAESQRRVKFKFGVTGNAELPLIVAEMVVLPKHYWADRTFDETSLEPPLGSGPYKISTVEAGRKIVYDRNPNWWGKDLPYFQGFYNFDQVEYDYYRDANVALEAFLAGEYDVKIENTAKLWETAYDSPAVNDGRITKDVISNTRPAGMQAFVMNTRRDVFKDPKIREALSYAFDFEWSNKQFAYGSYTRTNSFFENSALASRDLPSEAELEILNKYKGQIPDEVFTKTYKAPVTDGSGNARKNMRKAVSLIEDAGYTLSDEDGVWTKNGVRLEFEILDSNPQFERWVLPFIKNLKRIGVKATFRTVDTAQYQNRISSFDFDMTIGSFGQSNSPGNEQRDFWGADKADIEGSRNLIGIKDPVIDEMIAGIIHAESREDLVTKTRAMDRVLLWNHYVIPMWHYPKWRIAYWSHLQRPENLSGISPLISTTWWSTKP